MATLGRRFQNSHKEGLGARKTPAAPWPSQKRHSPTIGSDNLEARGKTTMKEEVRRPVAYQSICGRLRTFRAPPPRRSFTPFAWVVRDLWYIQPHGRHRIKYNT